MQTVRYLFCLFFSRALCASARDHLGNPPLDLCRSMPFLYWEAQNWAEYFRCALTNTELRRKNPFLQRAGYTLSDTAEDAVGLTAGEHC